MGFEKFRSSFLVQVEDYIRLAGKEDLIGAPIKSHILKKYVSETYTHTHTLLLLYTAVVAKEQVSHLSF